MIVVLVFLFVAFSFTLTCTPEPTLVPPLLCESDNKVEIKFDQNHLHHKEKQTM